MVVDAIVNIVLGLLNSLIGLIPAWEVPAALTESFGPNFAGMVAWANGYFPMFDLAICLGIIIGVQGVLFVVRLVVFIYDRIPLKAT